jgi:hypothetical protein
MLMREIFDRVCEKYNPRFAKLRHLILNDIGEGINVLPDDIESWENYLYRRCSGLIRSAREPSPMRASRNDREDFKAFLGQHFDE